MKFLRLARLASIPATIGTLLALAHPVPASAAVGENSGFYDLWCSTKPIAAGLARCSAGSARGR
jgi:hypothetical protein